MKSKDRFRGCLIGGAVGDALGFPVEFLRWNEIRQCYGERGITEYDLHDGVARISDDTQMTLFTATGLLVAATRSADRGIGSPPAMCIGFSYSDWYRTQTERFPIDREGSPTGWCTSWLVRIPEMFSRRAPGNTCLAALRNFREPNDPLRNRINDSKGCGGVMRVAPVGLYLPKRIWPDEELMRMGGTVAAITHGHSLGIIPSAALVYLIRCLALDKMTLADAVKKMWSPLSAIFGGDEHWRTFTNIIEKAVALATTDNARTDVENIREIGEGWVAEEALAIALYCALKYSDDFEKAVVASVNHDGDSDSTGSITGNIMGASLGLKNIPKKFLENLELKDIITEIADDLHTGCPVSEYHDSCTVEEASRWRYKYTIF